MPLNPVSAKNIETMLGVVSYGEFVFPAGSFISSFSISPIYDAMGKRLLYREGKITIDFVVQAETESGIPAHLDSSDDEARYLARYLSEPRRPLQIINKSIGSYRIGPWIDTTTIGGETQLPPFPNVHTLVGLSPSFLNDLPVQTDVARGPTPEPLTLTPLGNRAIRCSWTCKFHLALCNSSVPETSYLGSALADGSSSLDFAVGRNGELTKTARFSFVSVAPIDLAFKNNTLAPASWLQVNYPVIPGFSRTISSSIDSTRRRLTLTVVDTEIQSADGMPYGFSRFDIDYEVKTSQELGFNTWVCSLRGDIEVLPQFSKDRAWFAFLGFFYDITHPTRRKKLVKITEFEGFYGVGQVLYYNLVDDIKNAPFRIEERYASIFLRDISIRESRHNRRLQFSLSWRLIGSSIDDFLKHSGIMQPMIAPYGWTKWQISQNITSRPTGGTYLQQNGEPDYVLSFCPKGDLPPPPPTGSIPLASSSTPDSPEKDEREEDSKRTPKSGKDPLFHHLELKFVVTEDDKLVSTSVLDTSGIVQTEGSPVTNDGQLNEKTILRNDTADYYGTTLNTVPLRHWEKFGPPDYQVTMSGVAMRIGDPPPVPHLSEYGGQVAIKEGKSEVERSAMDGIVNGGNQGKMHFVTFVKHYRLAGAPKDNTIKGTSLPRA